MQQKSKKTNFLLSHFRQGALFFALMVVWAIFAGLTDGMFISPRNLSNLLIQSSITATLTMGMVLVIVTGYIDLSVGAVLGFLGALMVSLLARTGIPWWGVFLITLSAGIAIGLWHGFWISYQKVPAFIVTLASMLVFRGALVGITDGRTLSLESIDQGLGGGWGLEILSALGSGYLPDWGMTFDLNLGTPDGVTVHGSTLVLGALLITAVVFLNSGFAVTLLSLGSAAGALVLSLYQGVPYILLLVLTLAVMCWFVAEKTVFGRRLYAIGGHPEAARYSGINQKLNSFLLFGMMGLLVAIAGILTVARLQAATTSAGQNAELDAIAAAVIGGTSLMGGFGSVWGALLGALIMASLDNGMSLMNLDATYQFVIKGLILLIAVWMDLRSRKE